MFRQAFHEAAIIHIIELYMENMFGVYTAVKQIGDQLLLQYRLSNLPRAT